MPMNKKNVILFILPILIILVIILTCIIIFLLVRDNTEEEVITQEDFYGQRGNIETSKKIEFLSKNDDFLVGMMGLEYSEEEIEFDYDMMTTFALYIAQERYEAFFEEQQTLSGNLAYRIDTQIIDDIIKEFFGVKDISYSIEDNTYYSQSNECFFFKEEFEKSMWFYPVNQTEEDVEIYSSDDGTESVTQKNILITADSVYINDGLEESEYKEIKYDGKYNEDIVEYTITFRFDENGYLLSYKYSKND